MEAPPKLRIMCSYGGHIVPRPRTKSLCYAGGETRIVSLNPTSTASLAALVSHLGSSLSIPSPFSLKYQLPSHDLDSLISLLTDEDLAIMLEELQRIFSAPPSPNSPAPAPARIRLFVFPGRSEQKSAQAVIQHPKTEAWFSDALKGAKIMQKGRNGGGGLGFEGEAQGEDLGSSAAAESVVLETSSSFGSTSSSASLTNLVAVKSNGEDGAIGLQDSSAKLTSSETLTSEYSGLIATSCTQTGAHQDPASANLASMDNRRCPSPSEFEIKGSDVSTGIQVHNTAMASPYQLDPMQQHRVQYIQVDSPYVPQNSPGVMQMSSFYPLYHTQQSQQQLMQFQYQHNQPQPIYFLPVAPTQAYNMPGYTSFVESPAINSSQNPVHLNASYIAPQVVQTEPTQTDATSNLASQVYNTAHFATPLMAAPLLHVPYTENQQQPLGVFEKQHQTQTAVATAYRETAKDTYELPDDPAHVQIYKSQPPPPSCTSQYQTMTKATEVLLSEALDQLHTDTLKQQIRTSPPQ